MSRTLLDIRQQVKDDLDLNDETFITDIDLDRWANDAIEAAETEIHGMYEDYFLSTLDVPITAGNVEIDYPTDIYANKIRKILFKESNFTNTASHEVRRERDLIRAESADLYNSDSTNPVLSWVPVNQAGVGRKIRLYPKSGRTGVLTIYYLRNAARLTLDTDVCDIDEFERYVIQSIKTQAFLKDGDPRSADSKGLEEQLKKDMILSLANMSPDNNDEVEPDFSHYDDMAGGNDTWNY